MRVDVLRHWFVVNRPLVLFVSGQVFFVMGMAIFLQTRRYSRLALARSMPWLAIFGILHAFYEWGSLFIPVQASSLSDSVIVVLRAIQLLLLAASFAALFQFGVQLMVPFPPRWHWVKPVPLVVLLLWLIGPFYLELALGPNVRAWYAYAEASARYMLGFPGAVVAAWGLRRQAKRRMLPLEFPRIYRLLRVAGMALLAYGVLGGLITPPLPHFPANIVNTTRIEAWLGVPVEAFQALTGLVLAVAVILGLEVFEFETERLIERMEQAQIAAIERERIARDLHDGAIQQVYATGLLAQTLHRRAKDPQMKAELKRLMDGINVAITELRRFLADLHDEERLHLAGALEALVDEARRISGTEISLTVDEAPALSPEATAHIISFTREALSNAIRHARSPIIVVRLQYQPDRQVLRLEVEDHGVGMPEDPDMGYGLRNMQDRARLLGGVLQLDSRRGAGTTVILEVPLDDQV